MLNCKCSVDTKERTECMALEKQWYIQMIQEHKCCTDKCPFYKKRKEKDRP